MVTMMEKIKWDFYCKKRRYLTSYGLKKGLIKFYTDEKDVMDRFRNTYYGGIPLSIILLCRNLSRKYCYDRALAVAYAYHDYEDIWMMDILTDGIKYNTENIRRLKDENGKLPENYNMHCVVKIRKKDGSNWIIDTSSGLIIEQELYWLMENPIVHKVNDKKTIINYFEYQNLLDQDFEQDKYFLPTLFPIIEDAVKNYIEDDELYSIVLPDEIKYFKEKIGYDDICNKVQMDMQNRKKICKSIKK